MAGKTSPRFRFLPETHAGNGPVDDFSGTIGEDGETTGHDSGETGKSPLVNDPGTIDPVKVTAKRGRGRPRLTSAERKRRAKERGSAAEAEAETKLVVEDDIPPDYSASAIEQMGHWIRLAHGSGDWALSDIEAHGMATQLAGVLKFYIRLDMRAGSKTMAWIALLGASAMVYTPKILARKAREDERKAAKASPPVEIVTP